VGDLQLQKDLTLDLNSSYGGEKSDGFEREGKQGLPEDITPLVLTWRRGTSMEVSWRVDTQDLPNQSENQ
jgi:hypothetical protein